MYADNKSSFMTTVFTVLKLGVAIALIVFLGGWFLDLWKANSGHEIIRDAVEDMRSE